MRTVGKWLAGLLLWMGASKAPGGLVVTSYQTLASTNGYAPTSQTQYFSEQRLENLSPAIAEVSGDWTGPNANGTPNTWHFVGTSRASSTTTITPDSYTVEAAASFAYVLDTTAGFVDPASVSIYGPGGTAYYNGFFETDVAIPFVINVQLNQRGRVRLNRIGGPEIFDENNSNVTPRFFNLSGTLLPGRYGFLAGSGLGLANLSAGTHHLERSGSFENLVFSVRVPEPGSIGVGVLSAVWCVLNLRWPRVSQ